MIVGQSHGLLLVLRYINPCTSLSFPSSNSIGFTLSPLVILTPRSFAEALSRPDAHKWKEAAQKEFDDLIANGPWKYCQLPPGAKPIVGFPIL